MLGENLPKFPMLGDEDTDVLQPLPSDHDVLGPDTPYPGATFAQVSSTVDGNWFCQHVLVAALENKEPLSSEQFRFAFYLLGRVKLAHSAGLRIMKSGQDPQPSLQRQWKAAEESPSRCILLAFLVYVVRFAQPKSLVLRRCFYHGPLCRSLAQSLMLATPHLAISLLDFDRSRLAEFEDERASSEGTALEDGQPGNDQPDDFYDDPGPEAYGIDIYDDVPEG